MKINVLLLGVLMTALLLSCKKEDKDEILTDSSFHAIKNGTVWITTSSWANYNIHSREFVLGGIKTDSVYYQEEVLFFDFKADDISASNKITNFYSEWYSIVGGDAISDAYVIDSTYNNLIEINTLDTVNKQISGTFTIRLIRDKQRSNSGEVMLYENGTFSLPLYIDLE